MDYDRAQPSEVDQDRVAEFLQREAPDLDHPQVRRKLGLFVAMMFNHGWDSGIEKVRAENGYEVGYRQAVADAEKALRELTPKKSEKRRR